MIDEAQDIADANPEEASTSADIKCDDCGDELPPHHTYVSAYDGQRRCRAFIRCDHRQSIRTNHAKASRKHTDVRLGVYRGGKQ